MASPQSSDEGEIIENEVELLKATSLSKPIENGIDRRDRQRSRYSTSRSPEHESFDTARRSRSPRGYKRSRDDRDHYNGDRYQQDSRRSRAGYDSGYRGDPRRSRVSYEDLDRPSSRGSNRSFDARERDRSRDREQYHDRHRDRARERDLDREREQDRDRHRYPDKRLRQRSRSPQSRPARGDVGRSDRSRRDDGRLDRYDDRRRPARHDEDHMSNSRNSDSLSRRATVGDNPNALKDDAKRSKGSATEKQDSSKRSVFESTGPKDPEPEPDYDEPTVIDEEAEIERRRRRRDALLAKSSSATPLLVHAVENTMSSRSSPLHNQHVMSLKLDGVTPTSGMSPKPVSRTESNSPGPGSPASGVQDESSPRDLDLFKEQDLAHANVEGKEEDGPSAADYDPTVDMKEDELRDEMRHGNVGLHGEALPAEKPADEQPQAVQAKTADKPATDDGDDFDMFAEDFDEDKYVAGKPSEPVVEEEVEVQPGPGQPNGGGILEGDDKDGYYKLRIGEVINGRYQVQMPLGKGMFSGVARAVDVTNKKLVAIKIMRNNDALRKGGFTEIAILQKLNDSDPDGRKHIVKFERYFDHKGHLCMAFENLSLNLREVLRKFGNNVGINLNATRAYAHQIFIALAHMRKCSVIHADLKPDNILVNEGRNILKICDLGTAIDRSDAATAHNEITPYLVSRFYRAPEIILGMPYDYSIDMWSIGCTLYELYTGKILFTGDSNNQMLKAIMEIRGKFTPKLYKRGQLSGMHFDDFGNFVSVEKDKALGKTTIRTLAIVKPTRDLRTRLLAASAGMGDAETKDLNLFIDLLEHCLNLNPDKRIKPSDALKHPFFTTRVGPSKR